MSQLLSEQFRTGLEALRSTTTLLQRVRSADPRAGIYEAADLEWWWARPRSTDDRPQLFWFDEHGRPAAAVIATAWADSLGLAPVVLPDASPTWELHVLERGLEHAVEQGYEGIRVVVDAEDGASLDALAEQGFTTVEPELVEAWLAAEDRPEISPLADGYRVVTRRDLVAAPHHLTKRAGPDVERRLHQTSLYRHDLDLVALHDDEQVAAYGMFWFDSVSGTGLVEPMRTEDEHQRRGVARHLLTSGVARLVDAGATRIKICFGDSNRAARHLYLDAGFVPTRTCVAVSAGEAIPAALRRPRAGSSSRGGARPLRRARCGSRSRACRRRGRDAS